MNFLVNHVNDSIQSTATYFDAYMWLFSEIQISAYVWRGWINLLLGTGPNFCKMKKKNEKGGWRYKGRLSGGQPDIQTFLAQLFLLQFTRLKINILLIAMDFGLFLFLRRKKIVLIVSKPNSSLKNIWGILSRCEICWEKPMVNCIVLKPFNRKCRLIRYSFYINVEYFGNHQSHMLFITTLNSVCYRVDKWRNRIEKTTIICIYMRHVNNLSAHVYRPIEKLVLFAYSLKNE